jgi:hypothetical protein
VARVRERNPWPGRHLPKSGFLGQKGPCPPFKYKKPKEKRAWQKAAAIYKALKSMD